MANISAVSSYRPELEGIFQSLKHLECLNITPQEVQQWYDNERSVISSREHPTRPMGVIKADADITLAIHHLKSNLQFQVDFRHVYGRQDVRNKKKRKKRGQRIRGEERAV